MLPARLLKKIKILCRSTSTKEFAPTLKSLIAVMAEIEVDLGVWLIKLFGLGFRTLGNHCFLVAAKLIREFFIEMIYNLPLYSAVFVYLFMQLSL